MSVKANGHAPRGLDAILRSIRSKQPSVESGAQRHAVRDEALERQALTQKLARDLGPKYAPDQTGLDTFDLYDEEAPAPWSWTR